MKTKYASQTAAKLTKKVILLAITALAFPISAAFGAPTIWRDTTGSWFTCSNWYPGCPDSTTDAQINNAGTAQINLQTPAANAHALTLGLNPGDSGTVSVGANNYGTLAVGGTIFVGYEGTGTLRITSGGTVTSAGASIASLMGQLWVSNGAATVDGTNSTWTVSTEADVGGTTTGAGGTGLLSVTNGGTVTVNSTVPPGKVHVYGSGTLTGNGTVSTTGGTTIEGTIEPNWTLSIIGDLFFASAPTMQCKVTPANLGSIDADVSGGATLTGKVSVTMSGTFTPNTRYTLLHAAGGRINDSRFSSQSINFPTCQCFIPKITYDTNNVYLYLAPAPCCQ